MQAPITPANEAQRLQALQALKLLDTAAEPRFDRLTRLVQQCLDCPIVLISLIDEQRQWFKSRQGLEACETPRDISFCGHAILTDQLFEISDARLDPRFADNPLVTAAPFIRFYAGAPLTINQQRIGTLCLIAPQPRQLTPQQRQNLRDFADAVEQEIIDRLQEQAEQELKASRDQYQALVNNIPGITYRCEADANWTMIYISGSIDPLSGYPASDFIQNNLRSYASVIYPPDRERLEQAVAQAIAQRQSWTLQYRVQHRDGSLRWVEERGQAEYDDAGQVRYLDGFILDINAEKQLKQQLLNLTAHLPGVVYQYQQWPDGRAAFPYASAALKRIYGVTPEQVKTDATPVFAAIHEEDLAGLASSIEHSRQQLLEWRHEYRVKDLNGKVAWMAGNATPEAMPDGSVLWHGYIQDITASKQSFLALQQANQQLQLARERLDTASELALIGFWQASLKTGELWWSPAIYQIFGFDEANTTPSVALFKSTLHPDDRQKVALSEQQALSSGIHDVSHRIIRPDGSIRWVHERARIVTDADNPERIMVGSVQDITERVQLQQLKDEFIATVSHELRTPLTVIKGALSLVNSGQLGVLPAASQKLLVAAQQNSERLAHLINDLLDMEKLVAGKMPFLRQPLQVQAQLAQAVHELEPFAAQYQVQLEVAPVESGLQLWADSLRLQQTLANLLSNAIKFSKPNSRVQLRAKPLADHIRIEVEDNGLGIPEAFQARIFERFAQADTEQRRQKGGTGLGLAICKALIEQMGGEIGFQSAAGQGTLFYFTLPAVNADK